MCSTSLDRHPIFCIMPPHILRSLARNGTGEQRDFALGTLAIDSTVRIARTEFQLLANRAGRPEHRTVLATEPPQLMRTIFDAKHKQRPQGKAVRSEGQDAVSDVEVDEAYDGLGDTYK